MSNDPAVIGDEMVQLIGDLFPICRSAAGTGLRETLTRLQSLIPLTIHEVPSGTHVYDWTIPDEWTIRDAWFKNARGERIVDFRQSNLHVVSHSQPVRGTFTLSALLPHLHSLPDRPDAIPYRTSFYEPAWGFCLADRQKAGLPDGEYEVCIDSTLAPGSLSYGELFIPGHSSDEVLISAHICHPSLANDNLSGVALAVTLARRALGRQGALSYRFLFIPATIGAVAWLALHENTVSSIKHGLVLSNVGDRGPVTYRESRRGNALVDRAARHVLRHKGAADRVRRFVPSGSDERQFCSPGFDLPVGGFTRTPHGESPESHTSADNIAFVSGEALADSYQTVATILEILEHDRRYLSLNPRGEPQLGPRGLYEVRLGDHTPEVSRLALLWVLNQSDGGASVLDIAERSGLPFGLVRAAADLLTARGLVRAL